MSTAAEARHAAPPPSLSGVEKVAVLLLALGKGRASKLLKHFNPDELRMLSRSAADLRTIGSGDLETLVEEFAQRFSSGVNFVGTAAEIKNLLAGVMTDEEYAEATGQELPPPPAPAEADGSVWERASKAKIETLQAFLLKEHPQTAALVLSRIDSDTAAKAMGSFPAAHRSNLLCRLLDIKKVAPDALRVVELVLKDELLATSSSASHTGVADILNRMDKTQTEAVLRSLRESRPDDAKAIKSLLFTFEELAVLPAAARNVIFDQVPIERLVLALKGTDPAFQAAILSSIGARSRRMVEAELQGGANSSARDIGDARRGIVDMVLKMIAKGEIELKPADAPVEEPADAAQ
jgi:flagellar motor switch protein FliG